MLESALHTVVDKTRDARDLAKGLVLSRTGREVNYHLCRFFHGASRDWLGQAIARRLPAPVNAAPADDPRVVALDTEGYVMLPDLVSPQQADELTATLAKLPCHDPYRAQLGTFSSDAIPRETHVAHVETDALVKVPELFKIANDARVLSVVSRHLGAKPTALVTVWWSNPAGGVAEEAELFHRDKDDWRFVKLFVYLTDVDEEAGPHVYVPGSHRYRGRAFRRQGRFSDEAVAEVFGKGGIRRFTGPRGTAFLENTYGLHRGQPPRSKRRLLFQVNYSLFPLYGSPDRPQTTATDVGLDLDPWINRLHVAS